MGFEYDFDIVAIAPDEVDPEHGVAAVTGNRAVRASFRSDRTVDALNSASPKIQRIFLESGFSLDSRGNGLPHGYFRAEDAADRERILKRLFSNIRNMGVQGEDCGDFDFWHFLEDVKRARPRQEMTRAVQDWTPKPAPTEVKAPKRRSVQGRIGFALGLAVVVIVVLRYLASEGAAP